MAKDTAPPPYGEKSSWEKHPEYYLDDGNLTILVDNVLFRVWDTSFRRHSTYFDSKLGQATYTWTKDFPDGADDDHPLVLHDTKSSDFECLLWVIYPPVFGVCKADTVPQWIATLDLATKWEFGDIRELAIKQLSECKIEPIDKIVFKHKYGIQRQWAYRAYIELCSRRLPLTPAEAKQLGIETSMLIAEARERLDKSGRGKPKEVAKVVCNLFRLTEPTDTPSNRQ